MLDLLDAAESRVGFLLAAAEVHPAGVDLFASPGPLGGWPGASHLPGENPGPSVQSGHQGGDGDQEEEEEGQQLEIKYQSAQVRQFQEVPGGKTQYLHDLIQLKTK